MSRPTQPHIHLSNCLRAKHPLQGPSFRNAVALIFPIRLLLLSLNLHFTKHFLHELIGFVSERTVLLYLGIEKQFPWL